MNRPMNGMEMLEFAGVILLFAIALFMLITGFKEIYKGFKND